MAELKSLEVVFVVPGHIDMGTPMVRMPAHFLGAVAEFERELVRERVRSGLENARAKGKRLSRPPVLLARVAFGLQLLQQDQTYQHVAKKAGVSVSTLLRARRKTAWGSATSISDQSSRVTLTVTPNCPTYPDQLIRPRHVAIDFL